METTGSSSDSLHFKRVSYQNENFSYNSIRKEFAPRGSELFPLRAVPCGMKINFTALDDLP